MIFGVILGKYKILVSGALFGKMFHVRIVENNEIDAHFRSG